MKHKSPLNIRHRFVFKKKPFLKLIHLTILYFVLIDCLPKKAVRCYLKTLIAELQKCQNAAKCFSSFPYRVSLNQDINQINSIHANVYTFLIRTNTVVVSAIKI